MIYEKTESKKKADIYSVYNIYCQKNGEMFSLDKKLQISILLSFGMKETLKVYHISEDGTVTDMQAEYRDGGFTFITNDFGVFAVVDNHVQPGDINGDGKVNLQDSALLRRYLAGWDVELK